MPSYTPPVRDTRYVLDAVVGLPKLADIPYFASATPDIVEAILTEGGRFAAEVLAPLNPVGDLHGCTWHKDGAVTTPPGFAEAYRDYVGAGWTTLLAPSEYGGQGLPHLLGSAVQEYVVAANLAFAAYPGLTGGAIEALLANGSPEQKSLYLPKMISGEWSGTMNLTEPQCGTDLGLIRTKATPREDGSYSITGTKIFISAGEHDLTSNIIHLVLAKTAGAPDTIKGLSLFVVPKFIPDENGEPGVRNTVLCGSIEHKMGMHGNATCVMNYEDATGWLLGEETKGLAAMFVMMNYARLHTGMQNVSIADVAYQNAVAYARERRQGRAPGGAAEPEEKADPLIVHPDVRRMLMECRAYIEGSRALGLWAAAQLDLAKHAPTAEERMLADDLLGLMTPVLKGFVSDVGYRCATLSQQVFGGFGYIREAGMEQYVRDARIAMIYEGANGVQAMDLAGRKVWQNDGRSVAAFLGLVEREISSSLVANADITERVGTALGELRAAIDWIRANATTDPEQIGAAAYHLMELTGLVSLGWVWLKMANASSAALAADEGDQEFHRAKIMTARFFVRRLLPDVASLRVKIESGAETVTALPAEAF